MGLRKGWLAGLALIAISPLGMPASRAAAEPVTLLYTVQAMGMTVMEVQVAMDLTDAGYGVEFRSRLRGMAVAFGSGQQVTRVTGTWSGDAARPIRYDAEGVWRGEPRRTLVEWPGGQPAIRAMVPPNDAEREEVPEALRRGTVDTLSAVAQLVRQVQRTGRCDSTARIFDGRRLTEMAARTEGQEAISGGRGEWSGQALRCRFDGRLVSGFRRNDNGEEARRPQTGHAWMGAARPGGPVVPVRIESPSRWFGTLTVRLAEVQSPVRPAAAQR
ncbi:DUF3108 domain-containing protein [Muricoccus radiodurans]|uniref:DUF3108 domain-containing protein n=1 Tax=Muricoccus radiodurans TaxID=2231721 RepID=UPI003CF310EF